MPYSRDPFTTRQRDVSSSTRRENAARQRRGVRGGALEFWPVELLRSWYVEWLSPQAAAGLQVAYAGRGQILGREDQQVVARCTHPLVRQLRAWGKPYVPGSVEAHAIAIEMWGWWDRLHICPGALFLPRDGCQPRLYPWLCSQPDLRVELQSPFDDHALLQSLSIVSLRCGTRDRVPPLPSVRDLTLRLESAAPRWSLAGFPRLCQCTMRNLAGTPQPMMEMEWGDCAALQILQGQLYGVQAPTAVLPVLHTLHLHAPRIEVDVDMKTPWMQMQHRQAPWLRELSTGLPMGEVCYPVLANLVVATAAGISWRSFAVQFPRLRTLVIRRLCLVDDLPTEEGWAPSSLVSVVISQIDVARLDPATRTRIQTFLHVQ